MIKPIPRLFAPGPVGVHARIRQALAEPVIHHRTPEFKAMFRELQAQLARLWQVSGWDHFLLTSSGTGALEGAVVNFMKRSEKALVVSAGKFGERWARILEAYGCQLIELRLEWGAAADVDQVMEAMDRNPDIRAVYLTSADTSTGVEHPVDRIAQAIRERYDCLVVGDFVCDLGGGRDVRPADWGIDVAVSCSQKCLGLPPGLGIATVSPRGWKFSDTADLPRFYFDWRKEKKNAPEHLTAFTSAVNLIRGLQESLRMILDEEGLQSAVARYARHAAAMRAAVAAMGLPLLPATPTNALTAVKCLDGLDGTQVYAKMYEHHGIRIANGQDHLKGKLFRVGNMGHLENSDITVVVDALERTIATMGFHRGTPGSALAAAEQILRSGQQGA